MMSTRVTCAAVTSATPSCNARAVMDISAIPPGAAANNIVGTKMPVNWANPQPIAADNEIINKIQATTTVTNRGASCKNRREKREPSAHASNT